MNSALRGRTFRLYPTADQERRLTQWLGATRFVYNLALEQRQTFWKPGRRFDFVTQGREVTELRAQVDWLTDVPRSTLDQALRDLDQAYRNWRAGRSKCPTPRKRGKNDTLRIRRLDAKTRKTSARKGFIKLPRIGEVAMAWSWDQLGTFSSVTISLRGGKWYASFVCEHEFAAAPAPAASITAIDRGVTVFAALSNGELIQGPNVGRKAATALAKAQRVLARKQKGSNNRRKARLRVVRLHARVSAARKDFLHKTSTAIAKSHGVVVMEDLKVRNMAASARGTVEAPGRNVRQKAGLNRAILDQGWGAFRLMLDYKLSERGGHLVLVDPRDTSRTCSACGVVDADSREGVRFSCRSCGHEAHADTNAALNILRRGTPSMPVEAASVAAETGTSRSGGKPGNGRKPITEGPAK